MQPHFIYTYKNYWVFLIYLYNITTVTRTYLGQIYQRFPEKEIGCPMAENNVTNEENVNGWKQLP